MKSRNVLIGTSGFSYKEWKGVFYPNDLPAKKYLAFYATQFKTTEINNTFYRLPSPELTTGWYGEVPGDFSFTLKLSQRITHIKKLKDVHEDMERFLEAADALKEKMGTVLVQLPPYFKKDLERLEDFLRDYSSRARLAFEFRHPTWYETEVYELLRRFRSAFAVVEAEDQNAIREVTGDFIYMRLRKGEYSKAELKEWGRWIKTQPADVYCYLKHDEKAPVLAKQLIDLL
jgi:uncharacterized protein YecE (DUF72 family)